MNTNEAYPGRIYAITDDDLWAAMRVPPSANGDAHLERALRLGQAGSSAAGYRALNAYFRRATAAEWPRLRAEAAAQAPTSDAWLADVFAGTVVVAHGLTFHFTKGVDFTSLASGHDALAWLQALDWCRPMLTHFLQTDDPRARRYLRDLLLAFHRSRRVVNLPRENRAHYAYGPLGYCAPLVRRLYLALLHTGEVPPSVTAAVMQYLLGAGRSVYRNVERFIIHNIHTAGCRALYAAATLFPEFAESDAWKALAVRHLVRHSDVSFFADGCHQERCWGYGWHTLNRLTQFYQEAKQAGGLDGQEAYYLKNLRRAYRWFAKTTGPGFLSPGFGDDGPYDCTPVLEAGRRLFPASAGPALGVDRARSYCMKPSGFAFLRNGDGDDSVYANVTFGPYAGWHAHFDSLSLNLRLGATPLLEELSRFGSYDHPLDHIFRSPEAHNLLLVDAHPYDNRFDEGCEDVAWHSDAQVDYFSAVHHAYRPAHDPEGREHRAFVAAERLAVRRTVVFVKDPGYLVVMDGVMPAGGGLFNRAVSGWWHAPQPFQALGPAAARTAGDAACLLLWAHADGLQRLETDVDFDETVECAAGKRSYHLRARRWFAQTHTGISGFTTVLYPFRGEQPDVRVRAVEVHGGQRYRTDGIEVTRPGGVDLILLNPERLAGFGCQGEPVKHRAVIQPAGAPRIVVQ